MLAKEYIAQLDGYADYVEEQIKYVVGNIGPRESGEASEKKAQDYVIEHMTGTADEIKAEPFSLHPKAFMGWVLIDGVCMFLAAISMILAIFGDFGPKGLAAVWAGLLFTLVSVACILGEFLFYRQFLDPLFPKRDSENVICVRKAKGETKRRIVFSGHIDSAYEWRYTYLGGGRLLTTIIAIGIVCLVADLIIAILLLCGLCTAGILKVIALIFLFITIPEMVLITRFLNWKLVVPGANDNLTGVFTSMAVLRFLSDNDIRFENTEVIAMSTGCEEAGLRGAKAFAKAHAEEFCKEKTETICICTDTLRDYDFMGVYNKDMTGTVRLDPKVAGLVKKASENAGLNLPYANVFFGSSDAAALAQGGIKACCLAAMDPTPARYYHTRLDTADNLDKRTIKAGLNVLLESLLIYDQYGLDY